MFITEARALHRSVAGPEITHIPVRVTAGNGDDPPGSGLGPQGQAKLPVALIIYPCCSRNLSETNLNFCFFSFVHKVCVLGTSVGMFYIKVLV